MSRRSIGSVAVLTLAVLLAPLARAESATVTLAWDANTETDVTGYKVYIGDAHGSYHTTVDAGNGTTCTVTNLQDGRLYYFAVTAYTSSGLESEFSTEVSATADSTPPTVSVASPAAGATIAGTVDLLASASDNVGIAAVRFELDGTPIGTDLTSAPYTLAWDSTTATDGGHVLAAAARDAAGQVTTSAKVSVTVSNGVIRLVPQDTFLNLDATNYSTQSTLSAYTWPASQVANAILMKFDLSMLPAGAVVNEAVLHLALTESDTSTDATYTMTAHRITNKDPLIAGATGSTFDGVSAWTANTCCYDSIPLAQADISASYDTRAIDKASGDKTWTITRMVQEWVATPASNHGVLLNADRTALADRYRTFASMENPDATLRPFLRVNYSVPEGDVTPPVISGVTASAITAAGATISWTTNEASDSQVEYGTTAAYGMSTALDPSLTAAHSVTLSGLAGATVYHFRVRSRDAAANLAASADYTLTTADGTAPSVAITAPIAGAPVSGTVKVAATAADNVGVASVQFKLDGANLGAKDTTAPYSTSWNTTTALNGSHTLTAVARDAAGNHTTSARVAVTVGNDTTAPAISGVGVSSITASAAAVTWTTDEASDSQAQYGLTTAYGSATALNASPVTSHTAAPSGLSANTAYHFRVRSADAAGNVAVSPDFTFTTLALDTTAPVVSLSSPAGGSSTTGAVTIAVAATDDVGVVGVQVKVDGAPVGTELMAAPYTMTWDSTSVSDGQHTLSAVARDAAGNTATSVGVSVTVVNGVVRLVPQDTFLNIDASNNSTMTTLGTYTWPANQPANAIVMKFDLSALPPGAVVQEAILHLALVESDTSTDLTYSVSAHKVVNDNPVVAKATGLTFDGVTGWTANTCCYNGVPLAQADISAAYDTRAIDKAPGDKTWTLTSMVQDWLANPAANCGLLLNADRTKGADRYRYFASTEHTNPDLRPYLQVTYYVPPAVDVAAPAVSITNPVTGATATGPITVAASAMDDVGVVGVQFQVDGLPLGDELAWPPYTAAWDTTRVSDGLHTLSAVARDAAGNTATSVGVSVTVVNGVVRLVPQDTFLNIDASNNSTMTTLGTYTWPANQPANAIVMKFDLSALPPGAVVQEAILHLALVESDTSTDLTYSVSAHKVVNDNPVVAKATGLTFDGVTGWTANTCCYNGVPLAQADISVAYDTRAIDKAPGDKTWTLTSMVQDWLADPAANCGLLLNADRTKGADRYRYFASTEHSSADLRPYLQVSYSVPR